MAKSLGKAGMTLSSLKVVKDKKTGHRTYRYAFHFTTEGGVNPDSGLFYLLKPSAGFRTADGISYRINLARELLEKFNMCDGCHRRLASSSSHTECTCATRNGGPSGGTKRERVETQANNLQRYVQMQRTFHA